MSGTNLPDLSPSDPVAPERTLHEASPPGHQAASSSNARSPEPPPGRSVSPGPAAMNQGKGNSRRNRPATATDRAGYTGGGGGPQPELIYHGQSRPPPTADGAGQGAGQFRIFATNTSKHSLPAHSFAMGPKSNFHETSRFSTIDISRHNQKRHNWEKMDTFQTPRGHLQDDGEAPLQNCCNFHPRYIHELREEFEMHFIALHEDLASAAKTIKSAEYMAKTSLHREDFAQAMASIKAELKVEIQSSIHGVLENLNVATKQETKSILKEIRDFNNLQAATKGHVFDTKNEVLTEIRNKKSDVDSDAIVKAIKAIEKPTVDLSPVMRALKELKNPAPRQSTKKESIDFSEVHKALDVAKEELKSQTKREIEALHDNVKERIIYTHERLHESLGHVSEKLFSVGTLVGAIDVRPQVDNSDILQAVGQLNQSISGFKTKQVDLRPVIDSLHKVDDLCVLIRNMHDPDITPVLVAIEELPMKIQPDMTPVLQILHKIDDKPETDLQPVLDAVHEMDVKPDLQPVIDAVNRIDGDQILQLVQEIHAKPDVDLKPVLDGIVRLENKPGVDLAPVHESLHKVSLAVADITPTVLDAVNNIDVQPQVDLTPVVDTISKIEVDTTPVLNAVTQVGESVLGAISRMEVKPSGATGPAPELLSVQHAVQALEAQIAALPQVDLDPVMHAIRKVGGTVDLQPVMDALFKLDAAVEEMNFAPIQKTLHKIDSKPDVDLQPVLSAVQGINMNPQVDMTVFNETIERALKESQVDLQPVLEAVGRVDVGVGKVDAAINQIDVKVDQIRPAVKVDMNEVTDAISKIEGNLNEVTNAISQIEVKPQVDLNEITDAISRIEVNPQVNLSEITDVISRIEVNPQVNLGEITDAISKIEVNPQVDLNEVTAEISKGISKINVNRQHDSKQFVDAVTKVDEAIANMEKSFGGVLSGELFTVHNAIAGIQFPSIDMSLLQSAADKIDTMLGAANKAGPVDISADLGPIANAVTEILAACRDHSQTLNVEFPKVIQEVQKSKPQVDMKPVLKAIQDIKIPSSSGGGSLDKKYLEEKFNRVLVGLEEQEAKSSSGVSALSVEIKKSKGELKEEILRLAGKEQVVDGDPTQLLQEIRNLKVEMDPTTIIRSIRELHESQSRGVREDPRVVETLLQEMLGQLKKMSGNSDFSSLLKAAKEMIFANVISEIQKLEESTRKLTQRERERSVDLSPILQAIREVPGPQEIDFSEILFEIRNSNPETALLHVLESIQVIANAVTENKAAVVESIKQVKADFRSDLKSVNAKVQSAISKIDVQPQVDLQAVTEMIDQIDVKPQVDLQSVLDAISKTYLAVVKLDEAKSNTDNADWPGIFNWLSKLDTTLGELTLSQSTKVKQILDEVTYIHHSVARVTNEVKVDVEGTKVSLSSLFEGHQDRLLASIAALESSVSKIDISPKVDLSLVEMALGNINKSFVEFQQTAKVDLQPVFSQLSSIHQAIGQVEVRPQVDLTIISQDLAQLQQSIFSMRPVQVDINPLIASVERMENYIDAIGGKPKIELTPVLDALRRIELRMVSAPPAPPADGSAPSREDLMVVLDAISYVSVSAAAEVETRLDQSWGILGFMRSTKEQLKELERKDERTQDEIKAVQTEMSKVLGSSRQLHMETSKIVDNLICRLPKNGGRYWNAY